jgi:hypothetical protein
MDFHQKAFLFSGFLLLCTCFSGAYAGGNSEKAVPVFLSPETPQMTITGSSAEPAPEFPALVEPAAPPERPGSRAEEVMKALAAAYPDRVGPAEFRGDDWAVPLRGVWFYYAGGRLLPEDLREKADEYDPQPFYTYPEELPPWKPPAPEESQRMRDMMDRRRLNPAKRSQRFFDDLWRAHSKEESWDRVKQIRFLGFPVLVHYSILEELSLVEEQILKESRTNAGVKQWIENIKSIDGWNWRNIAATVSRSFHSYGAAIDILPKSQGGLETYWQWSARTNPEWWTIPYSRRFHPPAEVIKIFESFGFVWGGKWTTYDTMHFEYRPEIFFLSKLPLSELR